VAKCQNDAWGFASLFDWFIVHSSGTAVGRFGDALTSILSLVDSRDQTTPARNFLVPARGFRGHYPITTRKVSPCLANSTGFEDSNESLSIAEYLRATTCPMTKILTEIVD